MTPRTTFPASQRSKQILDAASELFATKGYQATTIEDLLQACGIAKGTLYYHFSGKEEVLSALVVSTVAQMADRASAAADQPGPALQRFLCAIRAMRAQGTEASIAQEMNELGNAEFHLSGIVQMVRQLAPVLVGIVRDGIASGDFATEDPETVVEMILVSGGVLLDPGILNDGEETMRRRMEGFIRGAGRLLGCDEAALAEAWSALA